MMDIQLAWRNIWRNPRRTAVILMAVVIGVWSMVFLGALMRGIMVGMITNGISTLTGHIQIHQNDYPDDPTVENTISAPEVIEPVLKDVLPPGSRWSYRVRLNAIASNARHTGGITLVGIDPATEAEISFIGHSITQGRYLRDKDTSGILIGQALAERFDTRLGHKLILMSQDTTDDIASRAFRIVGIFQAEMASTEKEFVFVTRRAAQKMLKLGSKISEISIILSAADEADRIARALDKQLKQLPPDTYRVRTWQEVLPMLRIYLELYDQFVVIWFLVTFIAMAFGLVNTTLMAVFERMREFGLVKALGMRPGRIIRAILTESFFILVGGMLIGNIFGLLSCLALSGSGIDLSAMAQGAEFASMARIIYPVIYGRDILIANLIVLGLGLLVSLYPAIKAARFQPVDALRFT
jgi:ABC-type lipoprotein release transport system permease subunit